MTHDTATNGVGRLATAVDPGGQSTFTYNTLGRVLSETRTQTGGPSLVVSYGYSSTTGDLTSMTYPGGMVLSYAYDNAGRVSSILADGENLITGITNPSARWKITRWVILF